MTTHTDLTKAVDLSRKPKPLYARPTLLRHQSGLMNKMGTQPRITPTDAIDGVPVSELVAQYGSPLFVYSQRTRPAPDLRQAAAHRPRAWP